MIVSCFLRPFLREVRMLPYLMICVSVVFEVFGDTMMKVSDGFRRKLPIVGVVVGYAVSFWMMSHVLLQLPLGPVYAAWTGLGIALTAVVGHFLWNEGFNAKKIIGLVAIIVGVKSNRLAFVLLGIAIVAEVTGAICLKASEGLTVPLPTLVTVIGYLITFTLLIKILQNLPLGLVYGIWGGVGSAATMLVGVVVWHDPFTAFTAVGVLLVIGGVYLLNKGTDEIEAARAQQQ